MSGEKSNQGQVELPNNLVVLKTASLSKSGNSNIVGSWSANDSIITSSNSGINLINPGIDGAFNGVLGSYQVTVKITFAAGRTGSYYYLFNSSRPTDRNYSDEITAGSTTYTKTFTIDSSVTELVDICVYCILGGVIYERNFGISSCSYTINNFQYMGLLN